MDRLFSSRLPIRRASNPSPPTIATVVLRCRRPSNSDKKLELPACGVFVSLDIISSELGEAWIF
jgi:hypothetical protein